MSENGWTDADQAEAEAIAASMAQDLLSEDEERALVTNLLQSVKDEHAVSGSDIDTLMSWALGARLSSALVQLAIDGEVLLVGMEDGEPVFEMPLEEE
jgi:hypothetical protein